MGAPWVSNSRNCGQEDANSHVLSRLAIAPSSSRAVQAARGSFKQPFIVQTGTSTLQHLCTARAGRSIS